MPAQACLEPALCDERRDHDEAPVAKAEAVVHPRARRDVDRLGAEALAHPFGEPRRDILARDPELACVRVESSLVAFVHVRSSIT